MRQFEIAKRVENGIKVPAYKSVKVPTYKTRYSAGADLFCAEDIIIPAGKLGRIHTGIKAKMENDEVLLLYSRSSTPLKKGLMLANGVGVIDADYYGNPGNDGEIMMEFYNFTDKDVEIKAGEAIGQAIFTKRLFPNCGFVIKSEIRTGGYGSTDNIVK